MLLLQMFDDRHRREQLAERRALDLLQYLSYKGCLAAAYHLSPEMTIESPEQKPLTNQGSALTARAVPGRDRPALERAAAA